MLRAVHSALSSPGSPRLAFRADLFQICHLFSITAPLKRHTRLWGTDYLPSVFSFRCQWLESERPPGLQRPQEATGPENTTLPCAHFCRGHSAPWIVSVSLNHQNHVSGHCGHIYTDVLLERTTFNLDLASSPSPCLPKCPFVLVM